MSTAGWILMGFALLGMTGLLVWCLSIVLRTPGSTEHLHTPADIETHDT